MCNFQLALRDIAIEQLVSLFAICLIGVVVAHRYIYVIYMVPGQILAVGKETN